MKYSKNIYIFLLIIFVVSILSAFLLPINEIFSGIAATPAVASLFAALFQLFRDQAEFERQKYLQQQDQIFNLGATSHMANIAFDKHVEFCEKYMEQVQIILSNMFTLGPTPGIDEYKGELFRLQREYEVWISDEISGQLKPFEQALSKVAALSHLSKSLGSDDPEGRKLAIREMYEVFRKILEIEKRTEEVNDSEIAGYVVKRKVRSILGIEELTRIRKILISRSLDYIDHSA